MSSKEDQFDIIIVGGGLVGASLAVMLRGSGYRIAVVESFPHDSSSQPSYDDRTVALSYGSRLILEKLGLWTQLQGAVEPIETIHISDRGHLGVTRLTHEEENVEALGYVAENRVLGRVLYEELEKLSDLELFCPADLESIAEEDEGVRIQVGLEGEVKTLRCRCLIAADGIRSSVRQQLNIGDNEKAYGQSAVICNVSPEQKHGGVAYERFTDQGPVAMLPMTDNRCSVVWTLPHRIAEEVMQLDDEAFLARLQDRFGYRLGVFRQVGHRNVYPLHLRESTQLVKGRTVIVGNAAHALHPVAGQGFNLALRDISTLVDCITESGVASDDPGEAARLDEYQRRRERDTQTVYRFTDTLIRVFSNDSLVLGHARAGGLLAVDVLPFVKHRLARQSMGVAGRLSSLGRM